MIDVSKHAKGDVLAALYNHARAQGMGWLHYKSEPMTREEADKLLAETDYFDYVNGRVMKVRIRDNGQLDEALYDRDNGHGAAQRAIDSISAP